MRRDRRLKPEVKAAELRIHRHWESEEVCLSEIEAPRKIVGLAVDCHRQRQKSCPVARSLKRVERRTTIEHKRDGLAFHPHDEVDRLRKRSERAIARLNGCETDGAIDRARGLGSEANSQLRVGGESEAVDHLIGGSACDRRIRRFAARRIARTHWRRKQRAAERDPVATTEERHRVQDSSVHHGDRVDARRGRGGPLSRTRTDSSDTAPLGRSMRDAPDEHGRGCQQREGEGSVAHHR